MPYTINDFRAGDRVEWKRYDLITNKTTKRIGTVMTVGKAKLTVHMDDTDRDVTVWPRSIANIVAPELTPSATHVPPALAPEKEPNT